MVTDTTGDGVGKPAGKGVLIHRRKNGRIAIFKGLGELMDLPRSALAQRLGPEILRLIEEQDISTQAEMVAALYDASLDAYRSHYWQRHFNVFRNDYSNLNSNFENRLARLSFPACGTSKRNDQPCVARESHRRHDRRPGWPRCRFPPPIRTPRRQNPR